MKTIVTVSRFGRSKTLTISTGSFWIGSGGDCECRLPPSWGVESKHLRVDYENGFFNVQVGSNAAKAMVGDAQAELGKWLFVPHNTEIKIGETAIRLENVHRVENDNTDQRGKYRGQHSSMTTPLVSKKAATAIVVGCVGFGVCVLIAMLHWESSSALSKSAAQQYEHSKLPMKNYDFGSFSLSATKGRKSGPETVEQGNVQIQTPSLSQSVFWNRGTVTGASFKRRSAAIAKSAAGQRADVAISLVDFNEAPIAGAPFGTHLMEFDGRVLLSSQLQCGKRAITITTEGFDSNYEPLQNLHDASLSTVKCNVLATQGLIADKKTYRFSPPEPPWQKVGSSVAIDVWANTSDPGLLHLVGSIPYDGLCAETAIGLLAGIGMDEAIVARDLSDDTKNDNCHLRLQGVARKDSTAKLYAEVKVVACGMDFVSYQYISEKADFRTPQKYFECVDPKHGAGQAVLSAHQRGCDIKGNITDNGRIYHVPGNRWYDRTTIDESTGERWFCTEAEAEDAGWRAPRQ